MRARARARSRTRVRFSRTGGELQRLDNLLQGTNAATWEWNLQTGEMRVSERWAELVGVAHKTLHGLNAEAWLDFCEPTDRSRMLHEVARHTSGELDHYAGEARLRHAEGHWIWVIARGRVYSWTDDGQPAWMAGMHLDIDDRVRIEQALHLTNERFAQALTAAGIGIWELDLLHKHLTWDDRMYQIYGIDRAVDFDPFNDWMRCIYPPDLPLLRDMHLRIVEGQDRSSVGAEYRIRRPDEQVRYISSSGRVVRNELGEPVRFTGISIDITQRKRDEAELREAHAKLGQLNAELEVRTAQAEQASSAKSAFLANMSHEIRTPLNAIIGLTYLLERAELQPPQADSVRKISLAGRSLLSLINDVLDLSKIESGELVIEEQVFVLRHMIESVMSVMSAQAAERQITLRAEVAPTLPAQLRGDALRLSQVLTNLISNAIKFSDGGSVVLRVSELRRNDERATTQFAVRDTGIGIPAEFQARLFSPFTQADASTTRRFGGTGLGLSIVKRLVTLMRGEVELVSAVGEGSEFMVSVPLELCAQTEPAAREPRVQSASGPAERGGSSARHSARRLLGARLLVVDDSTVNCEIASRILELEGASVATAVNGEEAIKAVSAWSQPFHAILMDIQMPVMDGLEATRRIRRMAGTSSVPILALTAGALSSERQRALDAGMDGFLVKPLEPHMLIGELRQRLELALASDDAGEPARVPESWPTLAGVDRALSYACCAGDLALFVRVLALLGAEIAPLRSFLEQPRDEAELATRLHKLEGGAGTVGALRVSAACVQTSAALKHSLAQAAHALQHALIPALQELHAAAPPLSAASPVAPQIEPGPVLDAELVDRSLQSLIERLEEQRTDAQELFWHVRAALSVRLTADELRALQALIEALEYERALELLTAYRPPKAVA